VHAELQRHVVEARRQELMRDMFIDGGLRSGMESGRLLQSVVYARSLTPKASKAKKDAANGCRFSL
jgi:hypothetical protein